MFIKEAKVRQWTAVTFTKIIIIIIIIISIRYAYLLSQAFSSWYIS